MPVAHAEDLTGSIITYGSLVVGMIITGLNFLMWVLFWLLGLVTNSDLIFNDGIVRILFSLWQLSRNVVNVAFAILLIVGAILTIVTANTDRVKGVLPKFVMAVILVNFSWFIPRVIYDVSQVVAYSVFQLPTWVGGADCITYKWAADGMGPPAPIPCQVVNDIRFFEDTDKITDKKGGWDCTLKPLVCVQLKDFNDKEVLDRNDKQALLFNALTINYARLKNLASVIDAGRVAGQQATPISALMMWFVKVIVVLVIHIALFFPVLALVCAFFIRIPVLWLTMAFMPFVVLGFVVDQIKNETDKISDAFIKAAFLPAIVGIPFAIGFIMLNVASGVAMPNIRGLNVRLPLIAGVDNFWQVFWLALSLGILWEGVFMALKKGPEIVNHFSAGIKGFGEAAGRVAIKAPLSVPLPFPGATGGMSVRGMLKTLDTRQMEHTLDSNPGDFWSKMKTNADDNRAAKITDKAASHFQATIINNIDAVGAKADSGKLVADALAQMQKDSPQLTELLSKDDQLRAALAKLRKMNVTIDAQREEKIKKALANPPPTPTAPPGRPGT